jgi:hypothetical protein
MIISIAGLSPADHYLHYHITITKMSSELPHITSHHALFDCLTVMRQQFSYLPPSLSIIVLICPIHLRCMSPQDMSRINSITAHRHFLSLSAQLSLSVS